MCSTSSSSLDSASEPLTPATPSIDEEPTTQTLMENLPDPILYCDGINDDYKFFISYQKQELERL